MKNSKFLVGFSSDHKIHIGRPAMRWNTSSEKNPRREWVKFLPVRAKKVLTVWFIVTEPRKKERLMWPLSQSPFPSWLLCNLSHATFCFFFLLHFFFFFFSSSFRQIYDCPFSTCPCRSSWEHDRFTELGYPPLSLLVHSGHLLGWQGCVGYFRGAGWRGNTLIT